MIATNKIMSGKFDPGLLFKMGGERQVPRIHQYTLKNIYLCPSAGSVTVRINNYYDVLSLLKLFIEVSFPGCDAMSFNKFVLGLQPNGTMPSDKVAGQVGAPSPPSLLRPELASMSPGLSSLTWSSLSVRSELAPTDSSSILSRWPSVKRTQPTTTPKATYTLEIIDLVLDRVRRIADNCNGLQVGCDSWL